MKARVWIFSCSAVLSLHVLADTPVDFSGEWVASATDKSGSDNSSANPSHAASPSGGGGHGGHGGMGGMGGGSHHGGRHGQDSAGAGANAGPASSGEPRLHAHALIIRQSETVFDIAAEGQRMAYRFDNRNNYGAPYGGTVTLTWSAPDMVIETHPDGGGSIEERYTLAPDGRHLSLHIREQRAGEDSAHELSRSFVRNEDDVSAAPATLPP